MNSILIAIAAALLCACQTGQTASEFFAPDQLYVFGMVGDQDVTGELSRSHHGPSLFDGDEDMQAICVGLSWNLTPSREARAARETTRAVNELASMLAMQLPERCSSSSSTPAPVVASVVETTKDPQPTSKPAPETHESAAKDEDSLLEIYSAILGLIGLVMAYWKRHQIPGVRALCKPRSTSSP